MSSNDSSPVKLLVLFSSTLRGGAEEYSLTIAAAAIQQKWDVHVAFPEVSETISLVQDFEAIQAHYHPLAIAETPSHSLKAAQEYAVQFGRSLALLLKLKPNVVLVNLPWYDSCLGGIVACRLLSIPTAVVFHLIPAQAPLSQFRRWLYTWALARQQQWITISEYNRKLIGATFQVPHSEILRIYNGVDAAASDSSTNNSTDQILTALRQEVRQELQVSETSQLVITVGRLSPQKGHHDLIPCIPPLLQEFQQLKFVWVGDGQQREALVNQVRDSGIADSVLVLGHRSDVSRLLQAADLFVFPTHFEGHPFALLEAMSHRLPIVTSNASGISEMIEHGVHGLLFRTGDRGDLLESLRWALKHPESMQKMSHQAQRHVQNFSKEKMLKETLGLLQRLSGNPPLQIGNSKKHYGGDIAKAHSKS